MPPSLESVTSATFADFVGQTFRMHVDSGVLEVELTQVMPGSADGATVAANGKRAPFSIVFRVPGARVMDQRMYRFEHEALGSFDLFAVPIDQNQDGVFYEVVFT